VTVTSAPERMARTVLVVDEVPELRLLVRRILEGPDLCVLEAAAGQDALRLVRRVPPDLAIVAHHLPDLLAEQLVRALRETPRTRYLPVLVAAPAGFEGTVRRCRSAGASGTLLWPPDPAGLRLEVERLLRPSPRRRLRTPVLLRRGPQEARASGVNLSESGMLIEADGGLRVGDTLVLSFCLPREERPLSLLGQVVREATERLSKGRAYGVTFRGLTRDDRARIACFVRFQPSAPADAPASG